ncbi:hypothetical protein BJV82DRAFT_598190, partial [Fennellomyces sp. T-0311]
MESYFFFISVYTLLKKKECIQHPPGHIIWALKHLPEGDLARNWPPTSQVLGGLCEGGACLADPFRQCMQQSIFAHSPEDFDHFLFQCRKKIYIWLRLWQGLLLQPQSARRHTPMPISARSADY